MSMTPFWNSVGIALLTGILAFASAWFWHRKRVAEANAKQLAEERSELEKRVEELEKGHAVMTAAVVPINAAFQAVLIKQLTHFHTPRMDALMAKLGPPIRISEAEMKELEECLKEREIDVADQIDESEQEAAHILPVVIKRVKAELEQIEDAKMELQVVAVAQPKANGDAVAAVEVKQQEESENPTN